MQIFISVQKSTEFQNLWYKLYVPLNTWKEECIFMCRSLNTLKRQEGIFANSSYEAQSLGQFSKFIDDHQGIQQQNHPRSSPVLSELLREFHCSEKTVLLQQHAALIFISSKMCKSCCSLGRNIFTCSTFQSVGGPLRIRNYFWVLGTFLQETYLVFCLYFGQRTVQYL